MRVGIKINIVILILSSIITFAALVFILFQINNDLVRAINIYKTDFTTIHYLLGLAHLVVLLFHLYAFIYIFSHYHRYPSLKLFKTFLLILGVISLFAMGVEKIMIDEIAREYRHGFDISEQYILNIAYLTNAVFSLLMFVFVLKTIGLDSTEHEHSGQIEEIVFVITQWMGMAAGVTGVWFTLHMLRFVDTNLLINKIWVLIPFYVLFLAPYVLALLYWFVIKRRRRIKDWYDEKQIQDMLRSSLSTLILSVPGLMLLLLFTGSGSVFWILYYIFMVLFIFSASTLYFFRIKDAS